MGDCTPSNEARQRCWPAATRAPSSQHVMPVLPGSVLAPQARTVVRHLPWGQVMQEQAPGPATLDHI